MGPTLELKVPWCDEALDIVADKKPAALSISIDSDEGLTFIEKLNGTSITGLIIFGHNTKDISPLIRFTQLEKLDINCPYSKAPDFSKMKNLRDLCIDWGPGAERIYDSTQLHILSIGNSPDIDLEKFNKLKSLVQLQIESRKLEKLAGINQLENLEILELLYCPRLQSLIDLNGCKLLHTASFHTCKKIYDFSALGELAGLRKAHIENCNKVKSLRPLANCPLLEELFCFGYTTVEDGDFSAFLELSNLKKILLAKRKHYSPTADEIEKIISRAG